MQKNQHHVFINLHLAYSAASGENINKKKCIVLNIHNFENLTALEKIRVWNNHFYKKSYFKFKLKYFSLAILFQKKCKFVVVELSN